MQAFNFRARENLPPPILYYYVNKLTRRTIYTHFFAFSGADRKPSREKMGINLVILSLLLCNSLLRFLFSKKQVIKVENPLPY